MVAIDGWTILIVFLVVYMFILLPLGISMLTSAKYTAKVTATVLLSEPVPTAPGRVRVTRASYQIDGQTYTWNSPSTEQLYADVGATQVDLYYNPKAVSEASSNNDGVAVGIGTFFTVVGVICWLAVIAWYGYDRWQYYKLFKKFSLW